MGRVKRERLYMNAYAPMFLSDAGMRLGCLTQEATVDVHPCLIMHPAVLLLLLVVTLPGCPAALPAFSEESSALLVNQLALLELLSQRNSTPLKVQLCKCMKSDFQLVV